MVTRIQAVQDCRVLQNFDAQAIPAERVRKMRADGLVQKSKQGYFVMTDFVGNDRITYILEPYKSYQRRLAFEGDFTVNAPMLENPENATYFRIVKRQGVTLGRDEPLNKEEVLGEWRRQENEAQLGKDPNERAIFWCQMAVGVYSALPFGSAMLNAAEGRSGEAWLSLSGDVAFFLGGPIANAIKAAQTARMLRIGAAVVETGVGGVRAVEGVYALQHGETGEALGYLGEATLRLLGASAATISALKKARLGEGP